MIFEGLASKLQETLRRLKGKGRLTERDIDAALREVRLSLLEADVNFKVVKDFVAQIRERCLGADVLESLTPGQQVVKVVNEELTRLLGEKPAKLFISPTPPTIVMMAGLQGSGKTTSAAKLASLLKKKHYNPLLVAADIYRPAAVRQLQVLGEQLGIAVFHMDVQAPEEIARAALHHAKTSRHDYVIIDTAGRLHIDEALMVELQRIEQAVTPHEILLVVDAMTGQDAVNVARAFQEKIKLTGVVLTKLDGDSRGGAALSVRAVTGCPVKFAGLGEKTDEFELFYPERMASRILGMGDLLTLIDKAQAAYNENKAREIEKRLREKQFSLEDFLEQLQQLKKMGPLNQLLEMIPGISGPVKKMKGLTVDEKEMVKVEAIINSMTRQERLSPALINSSRRRRIASGSGTRVQDVNNLLKQFAMMQKMLQQFNKGKGRGKFPPL
jgi:signal recognition particle subunit SRP54